MSYWRATIVPFPSLTPTMLRIWGPCFADALSALSLQALRQASACAGNLATAMEPSLVILISVLGRTLAVGVAID